MQCGQRIQVPRRGRPHGRRSSLQEQNYRCRAFPLAAAVVLNPVERLFRCSQTPPFGRRRRWFLEFYWEFHNLARRAVPGFGESKSALSQNDVTNQAAPGVGYG